MKKHNFPIVLSSIIALTVSTQSAVADNATGLKTAWAEAWVAFSDATIQTGKTVAAGAQKAYQAVDELGQEIGKKIDQGLENIKLGAYALAQSAEEMLQEGWQKIGNFYIKVSDATVAYVRTKTCTFKYNIKSVGAGLQAIANLPEEKLSRFMVCMEEMDGWAKMVSKEGHVIGQNVPCVAALAIPQPENLVYALAEVHNARLAAHKQYCGNTGGLAQANADQSTFQTTPANSTVQAPTITPMVPNGTNCTGEGITMGFGKNGVCEPIACDNGYTLTENNGVKTCVQETVKPVQKKAGDPCTANNAVSARINSEGNCAATECIDGWELARYDNGNSKGFCIKTQPKAENVVQEPIHIEPLETQVALLKVDPISAPDITLKMPQPALAVATPETNQVAEQQEKNQKKTEDAIQNLENKQDCIRMGVNQANIAEMNKCAKDPVAYKTEQDNENACLNQGLRRATTAFAQCKKDPSAYQTCMTFPGIEQAEISACMAAPQSFNEKKIAKKQNENQCMTLGATSGTLKNLCMNNPDDYASKKSECEGMGATGNDLNQCIRNVSGYKAELKAKQANLQLQQRCTELGASGANKNLCMNNPDDYASKKSECEGMGATDNDLNKCIRDVNKYRTDWQIAQKAQELGINERNAKKYMENEAEINRLKALTGQV